MTTFQLPYPATTAPDHGRVHLPELSPAELSAARARPDTDLDGAVRAVQYARGCSGTVGAKMLHDALRRLAMCVASTAVEVTVRGHCPACQSAIERREPMPLDSPECSYCQNSRVSEYEAFGYVVRSLERCDGGWFATMALLAGGAS